MKNRILIAVVAAAMAQVVFGATETLNGVRYTRGGTLRRAAVWLMRVISRWWRLRCRSRC